MHYSVTPNQLLSLSTAEIFCCCAFRLSNLLSWRDDAVIQMRCFSGKFLSSMWNGKHKSIGWSPSYHWHRFQWILAAHVVTKRYCTGGKLKGAGNSYTVTLIFSLQRGSKLCKRTKWKLRLIRNLKLRSVKVEHTNFIHRWGNKRELSNKLNSISR